jgi:hypothetical protein
MFKKASLLTGSVSKIVPVSQSGRILTRYSYRELLKDCSSEPSGRVLTRYSYRELLKDFSSKPSGRILTSVQVSLSGRILTRYFYWERLKDCSSKPVMKNPHKVFLQGASQRLFQ